MAYTLPRNLQHSYVGCAPDTSSIDDIGTYSRPLYSTGEPVIRAAGCSSRRRVHFNWPVTASSAYTVARMSDTNAVGASPGFATPITTAARTPPSALNVHARQPSARPRAYTRPEPLPTYTRSPAMVGLAAAAGSPSNPNAQRSFKSGTCAAVKPGVFWKRSLASVTPHDVQSAAVAVGFPGAVHFGAAVDDAAAAGAAAG